MARLVLDAVTHRYDDGPPVLRELALDVADGEAHALLGPSGAGKSTLLNLLSGLLAPSAGRVLLDDVDVTRAAPRARNIAQVFQFPVVYDGLDVRGNLEFPLRNRRMAPAAIRARVEVVAELMELTDVLDARSGALSAYDRQKAAMARALVRPDVCAVLLDEPLTAVEPTAKWRLRRALKSVQRELGLTMIYVTHDQLEALTFADRVSVIQGGRILQTAAPAALFDDPGHAFVGHFIGSPGMNLLPGRIESGAVLLDAGPRWTPSEPLPSGPCELGFRPEDARIGPDAAVPGAATPAIRWPVTVDRVRVHGERGGAAFGMVDARLGTAAVQIRQVLGDVLPGPAQLVIPAERLRLFRDGWRLRRLVAADG